MREYRIERLDRAHDRPEFACGRAPLDAFLRTLVHQYEKRNLGRTYVAVRPGETPVLGCYTFASGSVSFDHLPPDLARKVPRHPMPVVLLARLAVDRMMQDQGIGAALLLDALERCLTLAETLGIHPVEVDAIDDVARSFYEKFGFVPLLDSPLHLFLPVATIRKALAEA
ncbi:MAG: GNAT family N-acetyltransferase [Planctomycetes bacterium]|nr:GNAT family N-acetyltransferase [Planctomycetota bacterium]